MRQHQTFINHHVRGSCGTQRESSHFQPATPDPKRFTNISDVKNVYKDPLMCKTSIAVIPRRTISTRIGDHRTLFGEVTVGITTEYTTLHAALQSTVFSGLVVMHNAAAMTSRPWRVTDGAKGGLDICTIEFNVIQMHWPKASAAKFMCAKSPAPLV